MHPTYGAPAKKTASTRLRQYNVEPPGLPLKITSAQAVSQPCNSNSSGKHYKVDEHMTNSDHVPPQPHLSSNHRPFTTISGMTHKNYSVQDIILPISHTPLEPTTWKCGGSRHSRQLQGSAVYGNSHLNLELFLYLFNLHCT